MDFTYAAYEKMIGHLRQNNYAICGYSDYKNRERCAILRHDVDFSLEKALEFAELEYKLGVCSTYFVLLATEFYNVASAKSLSLIRGIKEFGHTIGLHFDEVKYMMLNNGIGGGCNK